MVHDLRTSAIGRTGWRRDWRLLPDEGNDDWFYHGNARQHSPENTVWLDKLLTLCPADLGRWNCWRRLIARVWAGFHRRWEELVRRKSEAESNLKMNIWIWVCADQEMVNGNACRFWNRITSVFSEQRFQQPSSSKEKRSLQPVALSYAHGFMG